MLNDRTKLKAKLQNRKLHCKNCVHSMIRPKTLVAYTMDKHLLCAPRDKYCKSYTNDKMICFFFSFTEDELKG